MALGPRPHTGYRPRGVLLRNAGRGRRYQAALPPGRPVPGVSRGLSAARFGGGGPGDPALRRRLHAVRADRRRRNRRPLPHLPPPLRSWGAVHARIAPTPAYPRRPSRPRRRPHPPAPPPPPPATP